MVKNKKAKHYVNNKDFYIALKEYKRLCTIAETKFITEHCSAVFTKYAKGTKKSDIFPDTIYPRVSEYIGECVFLIANKLCNAGNFCSYSFRDEMVADGYEDCILRIRSFDPEKSTNPFAYFTQACYYAAVRRIKKEKKQKRTKSELILNSGALEYFQNTQHHDDGIYESSYLSFLLENIDQVPTDAERAQAPVFKKTTKAYQKKMKEAEMRDSESFNIDIQIQGYDDKIENDCFEEIESIKEYYDSEDDE